MKFPPLILGASDGPLSGYSKVTAEFDAPIPILPGFTHVATVPDELGDVTGLRVRGSDLIASTQSGVDYVIPAHRLPRETW